MFSLITLGVLVARGSSTLATLAPEIFPAAFREADGTVPVAFTSAGMIVVLVLVGQLLASRARRGTTTAIRALVDLAPATAERIGRAASREPSPAASCCHTDGKRHANAAGLPLPPARAVEAVVGRGVRGSVAGQPVLVGAA